MTGRPPPGARMLAALGESVRRTDMAAGDSSLLQRPSVRLAVTAALLLAAAAVLLLTDTQGLVTVLVLVAACATASWFGRWAGAGVAAACGVVFITANVSQNPMSAIGIGLTSAAVLLWVFLAWAAGVTADERRRMNDLLVHRALHDPLTGLPNRDLLLDRLEHALGLAKRHPGLVGVLFVDLDDFKSVNDTMGHAAGDALLVETARRLVSQLRESDTAARLGGDEFAVVCEDLHNEREAIRIAKRITSTVGRPVRHGGRELKISASVGIAVSSPTTTDGEELLGRADRAMYQAKRSGRPYVMYDEAGRPPYPAPTGSRR